jgi:hypothetical protein
MCVTQRKRYSGYWSQNGELALLSISLGGNTQAHKGAEEAGNDARICAEATDRRGGLSSLVQPCIWGKEEARRRKSLGWCNVGAVAKRVERGYTPITPSPNWREESCTRWTAVGRSKLNNPGNGGVQGEDKVDSEGSDRSGKMPERPVDKRFDTGSDVVTHGAAFLSLQNLDTRETAREVSP